MLYRPIGHALTVLLVEPAGHVYPAVQAPLQTGVAAPAVAPKLPATHTPLHVELTAPVTFPYRPTGHSWHAVVLPRALLHCPVEHRTPLTVVDDIGQYQPCVQLHVLQAIDPVPLYCPAGHGFAVVDRDDDVQ